MRALFGVVLLLGLHPGPHAVAFLHLPAARIDFWYPAQTAGTSMTFSDYLFDRAASTRDFLLERGVSQDAIARFLDARMLASNDAMPGEERLPIILIAHGNREDAADQAVLAELLASHGFLVVSVPSPMLLKPMTSESEIATFAEQQAGDLEKAMRFASRIFHTLPDHIGIVSHSFGARAAVLLAMRTPAVRAIVSLDGGIGTSTGVAEMETAPSFQPAKKLPPLLHLYETADAFMKPDFAFIRRLHFASRRLILMRDMHHVHFTTYGFASAAIPELESVTKAGPHIAQDVESMFRDVLSFLQTNIDVGVRAR